MLLEEITRLTDANQPFHPASDEEDEGRIAMKDDDLEDEDGIRHGVLRD